MRWGLPALAVAWLVGDPRGSGGESACSSTPSPRSPSSARCVFIGAGVLALGLARLAAVRGDGPGGGSWFGFALVVALGITVIGIPAAVPARRPARGAGRGAAWPPSG